MKTFRFNITLDGRLNLSRLMIEAESFDEAYQRAMSHVREYKGSRVTKMTVTEVE